jgi:hypothetical protein
MVEGDVRSKRIVFPLTVLAFNHGNPLIAQIKVQTKGGEELDG